MKLVAVVGSVESWRVGLTYDRSEISAMLDDVGRDVGKAEKTRFSTSVLSNRHPFHRRRWTEVEGFQHSADAIDARLQLRIVGDSFLDLFKTVNDG